MSPKKEVNLEQKNCCKLNLGEILKLKRKDHCCELGEAGLK